jgi:DNA-binding XRE family transcriptional regulator
MGTVIKLHIHARTAVLRGSRAASTSSVIPFTRRFFASSSTKNQLAVGIKPMTDLSIPRSSAIEQILPHRQLSVSSQNANGVDMPVTSKTIGRRLLRTRQALKLSQAEFCRQIGVERNLYNPFEKGRRRITIDVAMKIRDRYGVTLDWIYAGDPHALPSGLYHQLVASAA